MEEKYYILDRIDGEYAYLKEISDGGEIFIAMALLPPGADVGSKIKSYMVEYTLV